MKIGNIDLGERPVVLAPMEDVTDASFRILCREAGAAMVTTEFVPSDGLVRDASKAIAKMRTLEEESPVAIQIYGHLPESMVDAARMADHAAELAGGHGADTIDINWGCPVSKIAGRGAGSGMMREPDKLVAITEAVVKAVSKPVTVKTRLGWDDSSKIIVDLAERLQDVGVQALTIHGRSRTTRGCTSPSSATATLILPHARRRCSTGTVSMASWSDGPASAIRGSSPKSATCWTPARSSRR